MDEDALMSRIAAGNEEAFRLLVVRWEAGVLGFLIHMLGSVEDAEDLLQDTFVQVFRKAGSYRPAGLFKSWLFKIAGNLARSRLRRRKVLKWVRFDPVFHEPEDSGRGPDETLERDQQAAAVNRALDRLPARQKQALVLNRFQGLRYREVAAAMDTTVPGVESLIQRALAALRSDLGADPAGKGDLL
jgi:RNA polymerase sigma-70 factor (ECF subfamily)